MGMCKVASVLDGDGHDVEVLDLCFVRDPSEAVAERVRRFLPEAVGISVRNIDDLDSVRRRTYLQDIHDQVVEPVRRWDRAVPVVLGGAAIGIAPAEVLAALDADYAVSGDGERASLELFRALAGRDLPRQVAGVIRRGEADPARSSARIEDLDAYPNGQAYRWIDWSGYSAYGSRYGVQTKRGCDRACVYCSYPSIEGRVYRRRSPKLVVDEIQEAFEEGGVEDFEFVDSTFNIPRDHALDICHELARRALPVRLDTMGLNPAAVDEELVEGMVAAGFTEVSCTPESGSDRILRRLGKGFSTEDVRRAAEVLGAAGLPTKWYFLFGGPEETEETVAETFSFIDETIPADHLVIAMTGIRVLPHTPLSRVARSEGHLAPGEDVLSPRYYFGAMDSESLPALVRREVRARPNCCGTTEELWSNPDLMRMLVGIRRLLGRRGTGWYLVRAYHRLRNLLEGWTAPRPPADRPAR
ncbi:MAG: radical SAM protein [Alphaproteobacteria bacterium]|nr:radical SAM protein [Alphaproteobacteria bacterium]